MITFTTKFISIEQSVNESMKFALQLGVKYLADEARKEANWSHPGSWTRFYRNNPSGDTYSWVSTGLMRDTITGYVPGYTPIDAKVAFAGDDYKQTNLNILKTNFSGDKIEAYVTPLVDYASDVQKWEVSGSPNRVQAPYTIEPMGQPVVIRIMQIKQKEFWQIVTRAFKQKFKELYVYGR